jgi:hypothetical protein
MPKIRHADRASRSSAVIWICDLVFRPLNIPAPLGMEKPGASRAASAFSWIKNDIVKDEKRHPGRAQPESRNRAEMEQLGEGFGPWARRAAVIT